MAERKTVRILSVDGGGMRGLIPAEVLCYIMDEVAKRIGEQDPSELFHLMAGTSTGSLITMGLATSKQLGLKPDDIRNFYYNSGSVIFGKKAKTAGWWGPQYDSAPLDAYLKQTLKDLKLSDVPSSTNLLATSYDITQYDPILFKSWKARGHDLDDKDGTLMDKDYFLRDVARASTAAPTYFVPSQFQNLSKTRTVTGIDGGVFANNPAMCAVAEARRLYGEDVNIWMLSLGTGQPTTSIDYKDACGYGYLGWMMPSRGDLTSILMDGVSDSVAYQVRQMLDVNSYRLQVKFRPGDNPDLADATPANLQKLKAYAQQLLADNQTQIQAVVDELCRPRDAVQFVERVKCRGLRTSLDVKEQGEWVWLDHADVAAGDEQEQDVAAGLAA
eukprot:TRINITY_DN3824_c0_g1_i1.p1 TRINITY_DN3824_c0_g1~~TRINITY_DN3824_c0_g1_i1.p1  ORF type:complete len:387 (+),score=70.86 TRINITY_DN3824_c0_g1_i1:164-1324(+)